MQGHKISVRGVSITTPDLPDAIKSSVKEGEFYILVEGEDLDSAPVVLLHDPPFNRTAGMWTDVRDPAWISDYVSRNVANYYAAVGRAAWQAVDREQAETTSAA